MNELADDESKTITQVTGNDRDNDFHKVHEFIKVNNHDTLFLGCSKKLTNFYIIIIHHYLPYFNMVIMNFL